MSTSPRSHMEGPRGGKASCKKSKKMYLVAPKRRGGGGARARARARPPPFFPRDREVPSARAGFFLHTYLSISTYLSLYMYDTYIYIHISLSLSLFKQVKLLERA